MSETESEIEYRKDGSVAHVTLNRPERKNALTREMRQALAARFAEANEDDDVRAVVLSARGPTFCAGADVGRIEKRDPKGSRNNLQQNAHKVIRNLYNLEKPVITSVQGACVGIGMSMALAGDMVVMSETARLSCIFTNRGLAPDSGAVVFLSRLIGSARAREIVYTARFIGAEEALALGLVNRVVPEDALEAETAELAATIAARPTYALAMAKKMFHFALQPSLDQFLDLEAMVQPQIHQTHDFREGVESFKERRPAEFTGR